MLHAAFRRRVPLVLTPVVAVVLSACSQSQTDPRLEAPLVRSQTASAAQLVSRAYTGVVSARVQSNLGFRVPGKIVERLVDTGQVVHAGQPLMRIDRTDLALANAAATQAVEAARAQALQTAADEKRFRGLVSAGAVSASAYDQAKAASEAAAARLKAAEAQARVSTNEAGYSVLTADADGTVVDTLAEPGQVVTAGQVVVRLAHAGPREALVDLPETVRPKIGSTASASIFGSTAQGGQARLRQLSESADAATRTFEARFVLEGDAANAPLGATVVIRLNQPGEGTIEIPLAAVYDPGKGPGVWVIDGKSHALSWKPIRLSGVGEETASVASGLAPGDRFVALGAHQLHEGERVRVLDVSGTDADAAKPAVTPDGKGGATVAGAAR
ncbi:RND family efflux transporter MFP subunit [Luteibacter sp. W1I16]|uniref:efflux RND transporter periplasmic adaptor subunit n=1 Tax=Luteibacter sp. W1I16 TaxID=3373922 RepID=UPI003D2192BB